jgi:hypothetical protein
MSLNAAPIRAIAPGICSALAASAGASPMSLRCFHVSLPHPMQSLYLASSAGVLLRPHRFRALAPAPAFARCYDRKRYMKEKKILRAIANQDDISLAESMAVVKVCMSIYLCVCVCECA